VRISPELAQFVGVENNPLYPSMWSAHHNLTRPPHRVRIPKERCPYCSHPHEAHWVTEAGDPACKWCRTPFGGYCE
jgi:diadenosine tetraphosphatase ApaH/serine/threonine PP2A family protein phosphatase